MNHLEETLTKNDKSHSMIILQGYFGLRTVNYKLGKQLELSKSNSELEMLFFLFFLLELFFL